MSYTRNCKKCGQRISLREMPGGQWVAFDVRTDNPHKHYKENTNYSNYDFTSKKKKASDEVIDYVHEEIDVNQNIKPPINNQENKLLEFIKNYWIIIGIIIITTIISLS